MVCDCAIVEKGCCVELFESASSGTEFDYESRACTEHKESFPFRFVSPSRFSHAAVRLADLFVGLLRSRRGAQPLFSACNTCPDV